MTANAHSQFFPRLVGADHIDWGSGVLAPALQPATRDPGNGAFAPCLASKVGVTAVHHAWIDLPVPDHAFYTSGLMAKLVIISKGLGTADNTLVLPQYHIEIVKPYVFTPTTSPNSPTGSRTLNADATVHLVGTLTNDAHAADGSDWEDIVATEFTLTAPGSGDLASTLARGEALLKVLLPYMPGSNSISFAIYGLGWSG